MPSAVDMVLSMAKDLVDRPEAVQARWRETDRTVELRVAPADRGKIIGRRGRTIDSLRILATAVFGGDKDRVDVELIEE